MILAAQMQQTISTQVRYSMSLFQKLGAFPESRIEVFQELYTNFLSVPFLSALGITGNKTVAEDIAQDVFEKAFPRLDTFKDEDHFCRWLARAAIRRSMDYFRKNRKYLLVERVFETDCADTNLEYHPEFCYLRGEEDEMLRALISYLKPGYRDVVSEKLFYDLSYREMAEKYNVSENLLRTRYHRALEKLKKILEGVDHGQEGF